jgi:dTDP-4-amino-4,6-dideoxygalactose transaminase
MARIYLSPPDVGATERRYLLEAFDSNWIAPLGPWVDRFEAELAARIGVRAAAALSSGTAALHLALLLAGVSPGDDVLAPTLTFAASANAVVYVGAQPVLVDCSPDTWNLDPGLVADELARRRRHGEKLPRALIAVDLYGQCADYDALAPLCAEHGIVLIEDAAEALGATYRGRNAGSFGALAALSFNGNKTITTSGGGMLVSNDEALIERARYLATQARDPAPHYEHSEIGFNYRLSNLLAAVGCGQLEDLDRKVERRRAIKRRYRAALDGLPGVGFMPDAPYGEPSNWLTVLTLEPGMAAADPAEIRVRLEALDIEARPGWKPMHIQPVYKDAPIIGGSVAETIFATSICLPSGSSLSDDDQQRVIDALRSLLDR